MRLAEQPIRSPQEAGNLDDFLRRVVWQPLPGSQELALACPCNHILYEGTRGPGKTDLQVMWFRRFVGQGYGQFWRGIIFDRAYKNLEDLIGKTKRWFPQFRDGARFIGSGQLKWVWPTGEELLFRHMREEKDYWGYHGQEYPFIGWNELTKYPTSNLYDMMMSCNRTSFLPMEHSPALTDDDKRLLRDYSYNFDAINLLEGDEVSQRIRSRVLPEIPLTVLSTTNPYGSGHMWVKGRFIENQDDGVIPPGHVVKRVTNVFNPRTKQREDIVKTQARIFGSYKENRYLSPEYVAELESITEENKRRAWLYGDWDIVAGGALDDVWKPKCQVVPRFVVPQSWKLFRTMDWGSTSPFSIGWWAKTNGEEVTLPDGTKFCPVKGSLIRINEWYGTKKIGTNAGLKLGSVKVALGIKERETAMRTLGWIKHVVKPGPADNQIFGKLDEEQDNIAQMMAREGVEWTTSDKSPGSRVNGLQLVRDALENSHTNERPGLYFMDNCTAALLTLPVLPRDDDNLDDVDTEAEDHVYDEVRYAVLDNSKEFARREDLTNLKMF